MLYNICDEAHQQFLMFPGNRDKIFFAVVGGARISRAAKAPLIPRPAGFLVSRPGRDILTTGHEIIGDAINLVRLRQQLTLHEGVRYKPYRCTAGKLTIGVGRNLDDNGISQDEADLMLANDIAKVIAGLQSRFAWFGGIDEVRKRVLIDMGFNLGINGLCKFRRMLGAVANKDYRTAAREMGESKWATQVGTRAVRLARMMDSGEDF